jgi:hypothetical protein
MAAVKSKFEQVRVGGRFRYDGKLFSKLALSLARGENRTGMIFHADVEVEPLEHDGAEELVVNPS